MKKKWISLCLIFCIFGTLLSTSGCSSENLQDEDDRKAKIGETLTFDAGNDTFDEDKVLSQLDVTEYPPFALGTLQEYNLVIDNKSEVDFRLYIDWETYDASGNLLETFRDEIQAFEHGTKSVMRFQAEEPCVRVEYKLSAAPEEYFTSATSSLSYETIPSKHEIALSLTNEGNEPLPYADADILFFRGNTLVYVRSSDFTVSEFPLEPGETLSTDISCSEKYDSYQVYPYSRY